MSKKENAIGNWTPRSKAAVLRRERLERQREILQEHIAHGKKEIAELEKDRERCAERVANGENIYYALDNCLDELRTKKEKLDVWYDQLDRVEKQIESCNPTAEEAAERKKNQNTLAVFAEERLATDGKIHEQLAQLSDLLQRRREVSGQMAEKAKVLEMEIEFYLDQDRFDALLDSLPTNLLALSEKWVEWLFGRERGEVSAVARERVEQREKLAHTGIHEPGDLLELSQAEFDELHRTDRFKRTNASHLEWKYIPPSVFSREEYEAAVAEAEEKGMTLQDVVWCQNLPGIEEAGDH